MKRISFLVVAWALFSTLDANCNQVSDNGGSGWGPWQTGRGGEFSFTPGGWDPTVNYGTGAKNISGVITPSFQSFCVEGNEFIYPSSTYDVTITSKSEWTGVSLTKGAALLYSQFAQGSLAGYDYLNSGIGRNASAALLQNAIWHYMGGQEGLGAYDSSNPFELFAATYFGGDSMANLAAGTGNFGVHVMNLWASGAAPDPNLLPGSNATGYQDMLVYLADGGNTPPVPDGGSTLMMLGAGLTGFAFFSRKLRG